MQYQHYMKFTSKSSPDSDYFIQTQKKVILFEGEKNLQCLQYFLFLSCIKFHWFITINYTTDKTHLYSLYVCLCVCVFFLQILTITL